MAQTSIPLPPHASTYSIYARGYWFTAPMAFTITGLRVPSEAGTGPQYIQVVKLNVTPPIAFTNQTTNFTNLIYISGAPNGVIQNVNIQVNQGDVIGILGTANDVNSYSASAVHTSTLGPHTITLSRFGYQGTINTAPAPEVWGVGSTEAGQISRIEMYWSYSNLGPPTADFSKPDTIWSGTTDTLYNLSTPTGITSEWFIGSSSTPVSTAKNLAFSNTTPGTYAVKLRVTNSQGADSVTKNVIVANPTQPPVANFIASTNFPQIYEDVRLIDLSTNGPTGWQWIITPDTIFVPGLGFVMPTYYITGGTPQNPIINFEYPGTYEICLIASNAVGSDTTCKINYLQVYDLFLMCASGSFTDAMGGVLYDNTGPLFNYTANTSCSLKIQPCGTNLTFKIHDMDMGTGAFLRVYDGVDNTGTPLWNTAASPQGMTGNMTDPSIVPFMTSQTGNLYVEFQTGSVLAKGFKAEWSSTPAQIAPAVADFLIPDTICANVSATFKNTSQGTHVKNKWYVNGSLVNSTVDLNYTFTKDSTFEVKLIVENCGNIDSVLKTVQVIPVTSAPVPYFTASNLRPAVGSIVMLMDTSMYCATSFEWKITPSQPVQFVNGTTKNSRIAYVKFGSTGCYDVSLKAGNSAGTDSLEKSCYINVINYCTPVVNVLNNDIGISRVEFMQINNASQVGVQGYSDYTSGTAATVSKGGTYPLTIHRNSTIHAMNRAAYIDFNQDGIFQQSEMVAFEPAAQTLSFTAQVTIPGTALMGKTRMRIAVNLNNLANNPCGPHSSGEFEDYTVIIAPDNIAPVITLIGNDTLLLERGTAYAEQGATAIDNVEGDISSRISITGNVNVNVPSIYYRNYNVSDLSGNAAIQVVRVVIVTPDTTDPVLTLLGNNPDTISVFSTFIEPGYQAIDNVDGNISGQVLITGSVNTNIVGTYILTYSVSDASGNQVSATRTIVVVDKIAPVIVLLGKDTVILDVGNPYIENGTSVTDNYYLGLQATITGSVDHNKPGTYILNYCVTDGSGNGPSCTTRVVIVIDRIAPTITLIGKDTLLWEVHHPFFDPSVIIDDNYDTNLKPLVTGTVDHTKLGDYLITYCATDNSGNGPVCKNRLVKVIDRTPPVISLKGMPHVTLYQWGNYSETGITATDNYDADNDLIITEGGTFLNTNTPGLFYKTYQAEDKSGNKSGMVFRFIEIIPLISGVAKNENKTSVDVYPNPAIDMITVDIEFAVTEKAHISVVNVMGKTVKLVFDDQTQKERFNVDMTDVAPGIYFVRIITATESVNRKFMLVK
jgi:PKD repeat protein